MNYERIYRYRFRHVVQGRRDDIWVALAPSFHDWLNNPDRVLDPAAGRCEFINASPAKERWAVDAVAHEEGTVAEGVRLIVSDVMSADLPRDYFDGVFVSNFLEHLPTQEAVAAFLQRMFECTRPGGRIAVMGPNFRYCPRQYFDFADHCVILTERSLEEHLYGAGFGILKVYPQFLPFSSTGHTPTNPALVRAYLRVPMAWRILGKQFLAIAERPLGDS